MRAFIFFALGLAIAHGGRYMPPEVPMSTLKWDKSHVTITGAYLISKINLSFINNICHQIPNNMNVLQSCLLVLNTILENSTKQVSSFTRQISFLSQRIESLLYETIKIADTSLLCNEKAVVNMTKAYNDIQTQLNTTWTIISNLTLGQSTTITMSYIAERPPHDLTKFEPNPRFAGIIIAGLAGALGGSVLGSLFRGNDNADEINALNENINKINQNVKITKTQLEILAQNVSSSINNIKSILTNVVGINEEWQQRSVILWNIESIKNAAENTLILLKVAQNTIGLLRNNRVNPDLLNVEDIKEIIKEGKLLYPDLEFPIPDIDRNSMEHILNLININSLGNNHFIATLPLVRKLKFEIYSVIPHPIKLQNDEIMIAEVKELMLYGLNEYMLTNLENLRRVYNNTYVLNNIEPVFNITACSCECEGFMSNTRKVLKLCNFKKLGLPQGVYTRMTPQKRFIYFHERTSVELRCPKEKIRQDILGYYVVPKECDIISEIFEWPAYQQSEIELENFELENAFDITHLPTITVNGSDPLHDSLLEMIDELPTEDDFVLNFEGFDMSLEKFQSYSMIIFGISSIVLMINTISIGILYIIIFKRIEPFTKKQSNTDDTQGNKIESLREVARNIKNYSTGTNHHDTNRPKTIERRGLQAYPPY